MDYKSILAHILKSEGGYVNHPNDRGGPTNKGITTGTYDTYRKVKGLPVQSVKDISDDEVQDIYYKSYWLKAHCDKLPFPLSLLVFDMSVNSGPLRAIKMLQRILGLGQDGIVGAKTLAAIESIKDARGASQDYLEEREAFYRAIVVNDSSQGVFLKGWLSRLDKLRKLMD
jgi:lysozyme family protein